MTDIPTLAAEEIAFVTPTESGGIDICEATNLEFMLLVKQK